MSLFKYGGNPHIVTGIFSKEFQYLNSLCDDDESMFDDQEQPEAIKHQMFESIKVEQDKNEIRKQEFEDDSKQEEKKNSYDLPERKINNKATPI